MNPTTKLHAMRDGAQGSSDAAASAILPVDIPNTPYRWARGIRAGQWVFATGQCGTDYVHALAPEVLQSGHPFDGRSKSHREAQRTFQNIAEVLAEAGSRPSDVVRIDQYYTSPDVVDGYHEVRREFFKGKIPPSTSNLHRRFARLQQSMEVQVMAVVPNQDFAARHEAHAGAYKIHASSGYSPALSAGDFRFVPGQTAEALNETEPGIDPEARRGRGLWKGTAIKLETDFIIRRKLKPTLEAVNAGLDTVVKAQVYLREQDDIPGFREVWAQHFPVEPATTIIATATPGFIIPESRIEINTIALARDGKTRSGDGRTDSAAVSGRHHCDPCRRPAVHFGPHGGPQWILGAGGQVRSDAAVLCHSGQSRTARNSRAGRGDLPGRRNELEQCSSHPAVPQRPR